MSELKAEDVARYLEENPIFFEEHADLLSRINVPTPASVFSVCSWNRPQ